jgi:FkbM family methyltransferase
MNSKISEYAFLGCSLLDKAALGLFGFAALAAQSRRYGRISRFTSPFHKMCLKPRQLRGSKLLINPNDWSQVVIFDEIFLRSGYDMSKVDFIPDVIIDCGAHIGMFSLLAASTFPNATVVAYEPNPKNVQLAHEQVRRNELHIDVRQAAVSTASTKMEFAAVVSNSHSGRLLQDVSSEILRSKIETFLVEVVDLKSEIQKMKPERLLLKVDIEGEERKVLPDIVPILPDRTALFFETHSGEPGWREIEGLLRANDFSVQQRNARGEFFDGFASRA